MDIEELKKEIVERFIPLNPEKIILFGSYAYGIPGEDSDIDLYVVTSDNFIPNSFSEKMKIKLKFSQAINELKRLYDVDLIVHTKKMHSKFVKMNSMFFNEIQKGEVLYE